MSWVQRLLLDERKILALILVNAGVLFVLGFPELSSTWVLVLNFIDHLITLIFCAEALVKIRRAHFSGYWASAWNRFDFILLLLALPSVVTELWGIGNLDFQALLALRVGRAFKFFRALRLVPNMQELVAGVQRALRTSVALLLGFVIGLFIVSLLSTRLFSEIAPEHYGDPLRALYSTFKIFTVEGWFEIPDAVAKELDGPWMTLSRLFFSCILLVCGVFGLSLLNSVFVDAMVADNNDALEKKVDRLHEELRALRLALESKEPGRQAESPGSPEGSD